jgi:hypothetical protein
MIRSSAGLASVTLAIAAGLLAIPASASASGEPGLAAKMRGHATMADAMRAHPELGQMSMSQMPLAGGA